MQLKIVVDTPEEFKTWMKDQPTLAKKIADAKATPAPEAGNPAVVDTAKAQTPGSDAAGNNMAAAK